MKAAEIVLTPDKRVILQHWTRAAKTERRRHFRARVILDLAQGLSNEEVAQRWQTRTATVSKWRGGFAPWRVAGLEDAPRAASLPSTMKAPVRGSCTPSMNSLRQDTRGGTVR